jgi:hypothetical protein
MLPQVIYHLFNDAYFSIFPMFFSFLFLKQIVNQYFKVNKKTLYMNIIKLEYDGNWELIRPTDQYSIIMFYLTLRNKRYFAISFFAEFVTEFW